ncbi:NAD(P)-dependent alcohol dehydrogenase [Bifidobacterium psychraerophilum]|jgi:threonine dehydrogenase-like Zn-dependent dehydrogenase|uniref:NAD(P)-dependent alcohol dehydrogenase n=1 Tax=Bifidobacterium psychraerophilum TaxID=218140 RepID=UPI0023F415FC|nr:NAD(P)-dependent alcohol dehydrogenase [Bifidobacterium psychraerophilum]MCI1660496.1 NAD(P)-dependent alcohol dehydrogenase [Bifidobacterium psychraerophilum]MCI1804354.1 NAD(P)-dependent alcohol dehydrogenase [Bifidobacterium psychraerophilum]MCI2175955.1 NAD(P)-dependent alcohol dehydrogenase [Bifidobacterium psychraerophilum]MCI2181909.1 NAD(P)-dependent alcohol dehydrogenase [Bifidobacterium psychraerophilum]
MKAYAMLELNKAGWIEKEDPACGPLDAICRPVALAPCTSDIHTVWEGAIGDRHNLVLGHEGVGEIIEVGALVKDFSPGDIVIMPAITPDWGSREAQRGYSVHSGGMLGGWKFSNGKDGVFAEKIRINEADANLALLPSGIGFETACMLSDMMPTGFHASEMAKVTYGESVCVIGIGPVGLMCVRGAVLRGASRVIGVGSRPICVEVARKYGATDTISYKDGPIDDQILEMTDGEGVDRVLIAGGDVDTFEPAIRMLKPGGAIGNVNYLGSGDHVRIPRLDWGVGMGHKTIHGGLMPGGRLRMERLASMVVHGRVDPSLMITHRFEGFEHIADAVALMKEKPRDLIKPVVVIG